MSFRWESLPPTRRRAIRDGAIVAGLMFNVVLVVLWGPSLLLWSDTLSWRLLDMADLYGRARSSLLATGGFLYSPAAAWLFLPLAALPWPASIVVYLGLDLAALTILARRLTPLLIFAFPPVLLELINGNIHLWMALAIWVGLRWPAAWSFIFLTKVTPGIGVVWFAARREWRNLAIALGATAGIMAIGFVIAPKQWLDWFSLLAGASSMPVATILPPLWLRIPIAAAIAWYAGRTGRAWLVPVACLVAMPTVWIQSTALLVACFPLWRERARWLPAGTREPSLVPVIAS
jgi:hypothetical protein